MDNWVEVTNDYPKHDIKTNFALIERVYRAAKDQGIPRTELRKEHFKFWTESYFSAPPHIAKKLSFEFMMRNGKHKVTDLNLETYEAFLDEYYPDEKDDALTALVGFEYGVHKIPEPIVKEDRYILVCDDNVFVMTKYEWNRIFYDIKKGKEFIVLGSNYINTNKITRITKYDA